MAFGSILEGPDPTQLKPLVEQAMPMLIELMKDTSVVVKVNSFILLVWQPLLWSRSNLNRLRVMRPAPEKINFYTNLNKNTIQFKKKLSFCQLIVNTVKIVFTSKGKLFLIIYKDNFTFLKCTGTYFTFQFV